MKASPSPRIAVIGGGPAGGFCALLLSRAGFEVTLYEAAEAVRRKVCGEYLAPAAARLFEEAGLPNFLADRFPTLDGISFFAPNGLEVKARFPELRGRRCPGYALDRVVMEEAILKLARECGAEVRMGCKVRNLNSSSEGWDIVLENDEHKSADLLIGADGRNSLAAKAMGLHRNQLGSRIALHCFPSGVLRDSRFGQMHFFADGAYLGLNASPAGPINFSLVCDVSQVKRAGDPKALIDEYLNRSSLLKEQIAWQESLPVYSTFPVRHSVRSCVGSRGALIGDAAGLIDPLAGEGIYLALWSASRLASQLVRMRERGEVSAGPYLNAYRAMKARAFRGKNLLSHFFQWVIQKPRRINRIAAYLDRRPERSEAFLGMMGHLYPPLTGIKKIFAGGSP